MKRLRWDQKVIQLSRARRARLVYPYPLTPEAIRQGEFRERCQAEAALVWRSAEEKKAGRETA